MRQYLKYVFLTALISLPFLGTSHSPGQQVTNVQETVYTISLPKQMQFIAASSLKTVPTLDTVAVATTPVVVAPAPAPAPPATTVSGCGDNSYAHYIYETESGCSLTAVNASSGDYGLGQSANGLSSACPDWQTDYACQNIFFTAYANSRYGGWYAAYLHELNAGWW
jgi:colicin import membrane protein